MATPEQPGSDQAEFRSAGAATRPSTAPGGEPADTLRGTPSIATTTQWLFAALVSHGQLAISIVDADGTYVYISPRLETMCRKPPGEIIGKRITETMVGSAGPERLVLIRRVLAGGKPVLIVESYAGVPLRTVIKALPTSGGTTLAMCIHHFGPAAAEFPLDHEVYHIVTPSAAEINPLSRLTDRELEVLRLIAMGDSQAQIARKIHRTIKTVEWHRAALGRKLGVGSRVELARIAIQHGLVRMEGMSGAARGEDPSVTDTLIEGKPESN